jgi:hypothetical protein
MCFYAPQILYNISSSKNIKNEVKFIEPVYIKKSRKKKNKKKMSGHYIEPQNIKVKNNFHEDCKDCLVSLGMKKLDAEKKVKSMFKNKNYNSLEQFILEVYKIQ